MCAGAQTRFELLYNGLRQPKQIPLNLIGSRQSENGAKGELDFNYEHQRRYVHAQTD